MAEKWLFHYDTYPIKHHEITSEGYLRFVAPISKVGHLTYYNRDTNEFYSEYVSAQCLLDSAETFKMKPVTVPKHPPEKLNSRNAMKYAKGSLGHGVYFDNSFLWMSGTVFDADSIEAISSGDASEISAGYDSLVRVTKTDSKTSREQIKRIGNHVAGVPKGRAGNAVSFKLDGITEIFDWRYSDDSDLIIPEAPEILLEPPDTTKKIIDLGGNKNKQTENKTETKESIKDSLITENKVMTIVQVLGKIYQIDGADAESLKTALETLNDSLATDKTKYDSLATEKTQLETDKTQLQGRIDALETELKELKDKKTELEGKTNLDSINTEIKERMDCWNSILGELQKRDPSFKIDASLTVPQIKQGYLGVKYPNLKTRLDALDLTSPKDQAYVDGMFETALESSSKEDSKQQSFTRTVFDSLSEGNIEERNDSSGIEKARRSLIDAINNPKR